MVPSGQIWTRHLSIRIQYLTTHEYIMYQIQNIILSASCEGVSPGGYAPSLQLAGRDFPLFPCWPTQGLTPPPYRIRPTAATGSA